MIDKFNLINNYNKNKIFQNFTKNMKMHNTYAFSKLYFVLSIFIINLCLFR